MRNSGLIAGLIAATMLASGPRAGRPVFSPAPGSPFPAGPRPAGVEVADLDGDGALDIVTADSGGETVTMRRGNGRGGFGRPQSFAAMTNPHLLAVGDFNSDRRLDLAVSAHDSNDVVILLNQGKATLSRRPPITVFSGTRRHNHGLAAADVNGDGKTDLTVGHQDLDRIAILIGDGRGGFRPAAGSPIATGRAPYPHALADVNGDRKIDLLVPNIVGNAVQVFSGDGSGRFAAPQRLETGLARPYFVAARNLSQDRNLDLVVTHDDTSMVTVLLGDGKGSFQHAPGSPFDSGRRGGEVVAGDLNQDGKPDLAIACGTSIRLFTGDGSGAFRAAGVLSNPGDGWNLALADVNRDGRLDVIAPAPETSSVHVLLAR